MIEKLEEIKQQGNYAINVYYGENIGCDDLSVPIMEREVKVIYVPVGYLGELRKLWRGSYKDFLKFDINQEPKIINNPPQSNEYTDAGFYMWGTDRAIEEYKKGEESE